MIDVSDTVADNGDDLARLNVAFETCIRKGEHAEALRLLKRDLLETWYGFRPESLRTLFGELVDSGIDVDGTVRSMLHFVGSPEIFRVQDPTGVSISARYGTQTHLLIDVARMIQRRRSGRVLEALASSEELGVRIAKLQKTYDLRGGWDMWTAVQTGVTAMLAGDFRRALLEFTAAQMHAYVPSLSFVTREAYVNAALVHASFGSQDEAWQLLAQAEQIPRSSSWVESRIDASVLIVKSMISFQDGVEAKAIIDSVPRQDIGELWPFYLIGMHRAYERAGYRTVLERIIRKFASMPFPAILGEGLTGSAIPTIMGSLSLANGNLRVAKEFYDLADPNFLGTVTMRAHLELLSGRPTESIRLAESCVSQSRGLRQAEIWRLSILARSWLMLDAPDHVIPVLTAAINMPGGLHAYELAHFAPEVRAFGQENVPGWPNYEGEGSRFIDLISEVIVPLSDREIEIVALLRRNVSRNQMADELFVSLNTLKTHLSKIYRKLGVTNKIAAIVEAEKRGLI